MEVQTTNQDTEEISQTVPADPGTQPEQAAAPEPAPETLTEPSSNGTQNPPGKVVELKTSEFRRIKQQARQKGFKKSEAETLARFAKYGCESLDDVEKMLESKQTQPKPPKVTEKEETTMATVQDKDKGKMRQRKANREEQSRAKEQVAMRKYRAESRRRKDLERQLDAKDAEIELREAAVRAGVKDVDYMMRLLVRKNKGKSEEDLAQFNETEFFESVRESRPYLFGEVVVPATTGTAGNGETEVPEPPAPGEVTTTEANGQQFDGRKASQEDFDKRIRDMGLSMQ